MTRIRHRQHGNPFNIRGPISVPDWQARFGRAAPFAIDVGFGAGGFLLALARQRPEWNVLGLEIRNHWVEQVTTTAAEAGLTNVVALVANANSHLEELVPDGSVVFVSLNFPDPWFKQSHHKRRVVSPAWLDLVARKLASGGVLHYMTDHEPSAKEALAALRGQPDFRDLGPGFVAASTTGLQSEREQTHLRRGEQVYRLAFARADRVPGTV